LGGVGVGDLREGVALGLHVDPALDGAGDHGPAQFTVGDRLQGDGDPAAVVRVGRRGTGEHDGAGELVGVVGRVDQRADDPQHARPWFRRLRELRDELADDWDRPLPGLSMGMSGDFAVAIEEGSTVVRIGSAIFGNRPPAAEYEP